MNIDLEERATELEAQAAKAATEGQAETLRRSAAKLRRLAKEQERERRSEFEHWVRLRRQAFLEAGGTEDEFAAEYPTARLRRQYVEERAAQLQQQREAEARQLTRSLMGA